MLDKSEAIRVEKKGSTNTYIFICKNCPSEIRAQTSFLKKHTGHCRKCSVESRRKDPLKRTYERMKLNNSRKRNLNFDLTFEEFKFISQVSSCCYCGQDVKWDVRGQSFDKYNLDRKDNNRGYIIDNVAVCCTECNTMKRDFYSFEEFQLIRRLLDISRKSKKNHDLLKYSLFSWDDKIEYF